MTRLLLLIPLLLAGIAAAQVYKYVDEDGNVVYSDEPPAGEEGEVVNLEPYDPPSTPTPIGRVRRDDALSPDVEPVDPARINRLAEQAVADQQRWCNEAREALEVLHQGMPVYSIGEGKYRAAWSGDSYEGPRIYLNDQQREAAIRAQIRKLVMNCKDPLNEAQQEAASRKWVNAEKCEAARVTLSEVANPDSRASESEIENRQQDVDRYCREQ